MKNSYTKFDDYIAIDLRRRNGEIFQTFIDIDDFEKVNAYPGSYYAGLYPNLRGQYYAFLTIYKGKGSDGKYKYQILRLHKIIMDIKHGYEEYDVDHINGNSLDNRKENLRLSKADSNTKNRKDKNSNNKSGYRNVCFIDGYYRVQLQINGKNYRFPEKFKDAKEAGEFAEKMREKYYGDFAGIG